MRDDLLDAAQREWLARRLQQALSDELGQEVGRFEAEAVLDTFAVELGAACYNRGLMDAQAAMRRRIEIAHEAVDELVRPTPFDR